MVGIVACGVYLPLYRLGGETEGWGRGGERTVANYDEDSITMAVAAAANCLAGRDRSQVDALYLASTTVPYSEGPLAALVATALDLRRDIGTVNLTGSLRGGTTALKLAAQAVKSGSAQQVLVAVADVRVAMPGSGLEPDIGDGAVAFLIGGSGVAAAWEDDYSVSDEILDWWREDGRTIIRQWEDRFTVDEGYMSILPEAVSGLMQRTGLGIGDLEKVVLYAPDLRRHRQMVQHLKVDAARVQDGLFGTMGNTGTAFSPCMLAAALEEVEPGERILVTGYGNGADAILLRATDAIGELKGRRTLARYLESKKTVSDYIKYASWRGLIPTAEPARRPPDEVPAPSALHRSRDRNIRFAGVKCQNCGTPQYPPARICVQCQAKDRMEPYRFSDKPATLFTYSYDQISRTKDPPLIIGLVDFEGGGRVRITLTDGEVSELRRGMPLRMSFRKLYVYNEEGIHNYYWKATPVRV